MEQCANCGHALGIGRYCVNCGQPHGQVAGGPDDDPRVSTAERPAVPSDPVSPPTQLSEPTLSPWGTPAPPAPQAPPGPEPGPARAAAPPPVYETPPQVRYPLYADDVPAEVTTAAPAPAWETAPSGGAGSEPGRRRTVLPWVAVALVLLLMAGTGLFLLLGGGDDETADDPAPGTSGTPDPGGSTGPDDAATSTDPTEPTTPTTEPAPGEAVDVARTATAIAPSTADPSRDVDGNAVRYDAFNMLDRQDDTAWRTPGDATGATIGFDLAEPTRLETVGLLNGYAKSDPGYDGYTANRRVLAVEWIFDDGTVVPQTLDGATREVQSIDVDVVTSSVQLRIVGVSRPGKGDAGRDFTAISTVELVGTPG